MLFAPKEKGQGFVEYLLLLALIAFIVIVVLALFGDSVKELWNSTVGPLIEAFS